MRKELKSRRDFKNGSNWMSLWKNNQVYRFFNKRIKKKTKNFFWKSKDHKCLDENFYENIKAVQL